MKKGLARDSLRVRVQGGKRQDKARGRDAAGLFLYNLLRRGKRIMLFA